LLRWEIPMFEARVCWQRDGRQQNAVSLTRFTPFSLPLVRKFCHGPFLIQHDMLSVLMFPNGKTLFAEIPCHCTLWPRPVSLSNQRVDQLGICPRGSIPAHPLAECSLRPAAGDDRQTSGPNRPSFGQSQLVNGGSLLGTIFRRVAWCLRVIYPRSHQDCKRQAG